jgi:hypothetical protein
MTGRPPRVNPFATAFVQPGAVPFLFPPGASAELLAAKLRATGGYGQVVGPHGSGKSTLLAALIPRLTAWRVRAVRLTADTPSDVGSLPGPGELLVVDGFERLGWLTRRWVVRGCRRAGGGLVVTAHRNVGLPVLFCAAVDVETAAAVVAKLGAADVLTGYDLGRRLSHHRGSLRDVLFELYDRWDGTGPH